MTVTATSSAALVASAIIDLIAKSATFQARINAYHGGGATEANARLHIYGGEVWTPDEDLADLRPFAAVFSPDQAMQAVVQCSALQYLPEGSVAFVLVDTARYTDCYGDDPADHHNDSWVDALNWIHGTVDDFQGVAVADVPFRPNSIELLEPVTRSDVNARQTVNEDGEKTHDFWLGLFSASYGERGGA